MAVPAMSQVRVFSDRPDNIFFKSVETPIKNRTERIVASLKLYWLYRNAIFDSYSEKEDLAPDI
jgi:hypothetical protein